MKQLITLQINGNRHNIIAEPRDTLLEVVRQLGLKGTKEGCSTGECGSCTVIVDGIPVLGCLTLAVEVQGKAITTVEGLAHGMELHPVQQAFVEHGAVQCGFCSPGMLTAAKALLDVNNNPTTEAINTALGGHLCRCTGYIKIRKAIHTAAAQMQTANSISRTT